MQMFGEYGKSAAAFVLKHSKLERKDRQPSVAMGAEIRAVRAQEKALHAFLADTRYINLFPVVAADGHLDVEMDLSHTQATIKSVTDYLDKVFTEWNEDDDRHINI